MGWSDLGEALLALFDGWFGLASGAYVLWSVMSDNQKAQLIAYVSNQIRGALFGAATLLADVESQLHPIVVAFAGAIRKGASPIVDVVYNDFKGMAINAFNTVEKAASAGGLSTPENAIPQAAAAFSEAAALGMSSHAVAMAFEAVFPEKLNTINAFAPLLAELAGFKEVISKVRDPLMEAAFGQSAKYYYNSVFKPELPSEGDAVEWHSRGLLTDDQLRVIFKYSGLKSEYEDAYVKSAYRGISAFIAARMFESGALSLDDTRDMMTFAGLRPVDQDRVLISYTTLVLQPYIRPYLTAVETAAERGVMSAQDVQDAVNAAVSPPVLPLPPAGAPTTGNELRDFLTQTVNHYVQLTIATRKLEQLAEIYRKSVSEAYKYGLIADADYVLHLEAIGIAQADAEAHYAVDSIAKQGRAALELAREEAAAARRLEAGAVRAALAEFRSGDLDAAALTAALIAAGMDPALAGFAVAFATARQQGAQVIVHGKLVDRADAQALHEQVAAIEAQTKKKLLTPDQALNELAALGIPGPNRNALVAAWAAQAYKTVLPV